MRALFVSVISLLIILLCWLVFFNYSKKTLQPVIDQCDTVIMSDIEADRWDDAYRSFQIQYDQWHTYKKRGLYFLDTETVNRTDSTFAKTLMYIKAKDLSNSSGELLSLTEEVKFLLQSEEPSLRNIL